MSITTPDDRITHYEPIVATTEFAADFPVFDNSDLAVFVDDVERHDFTVTASYVEGISNNAVVILAEAVTGRVDVVGDRDPRRTNRFVNGAPLPNWAQNLAFDTVQAEVQEQHRNYGRAHKAPYGEQGGVFSAADVGSAQQYAYDAAQSRDAAAQSAADTNMAKDLVLQAIGSAISPRATLALAIADAPAIDPEYYEIAYRDTNYVAGSGGKYRKQVSEPTHALKFQNANGTWYGFEGERLVPQMFGTLGASAAADTSIFQSMFAAALAIGAKECDASSITGSITFTADIFNGMHTLPIRFVTSEVTISMDFNGTGGFKIPSFCEWVCKGTKIKPAVAITNIGGENSPGAAMVQTYFGGDDGRAATGSGTSITVTDATGIHVGTQVSVFGTRRAFEFQYELGSSITPTTAIIPLVNTGVGDPPVNHSDPGMIIVRIGGTEFVRGLYTAGNLDTTVAGGGRGLYGSAASSHLSGASCLLMLADPKRVVAMSGTTLTLDSALDNACSGNPMRFGSVGARLRGDVEIDGEFDRAVPPVNIWSCLGGTLTAGPFCDGPVRLKRGSHGGAFFIGTRDLVAEIEKIEGCGDPATSLGATVWLFGTNQNHYVHVKEANDGNIAAAIDNKSSGIISLNLADANRYGTTLIDRILDHKEGFDVTACHDQYCWAGYSQCSASHAGIFNGLPQQWTAIVPTGVTIEIGQMHTFRMPTGNSLTGNTVILEGLSNRVIESSVSVPATGVSGGTVVEIGLSLSGTATGAKVVASPVGPLTAGCAFSHAYVPSAGSLRLCYANITASGTTLAGHTAHVKVEQPWG